MSDTKSPVDDGGPASMIDTDLAGPDRGVALLTVAGEIDTLTAPRLDPALVRLVDEPAATLVVDLTGVHFLASSGLAVLIEAAHRASTSGRALRLLVQGRPVLRGAADHRHRPAVRAAHRAGVRAAPRPGGLSPARD